MTLNSKKRTSSSILFQARDISITDFEHMGQQYLSKNHEFYIMNGTLIVNKLIQVWDRALNKQEQTVAYLSRFSISW